MRLARGAVVETSRANAPRREPRVVDLEAGPLADVAILVHARRERETIMSLARAIAERLVRDAVSADDRALHALFDEAIAALGASRRLVAHLSPDDARRLSDRLAELGAQVVVAPERDSGSLRVESERGAVELGIEDAVRRLASSLEPR